MSELPPTQAAVFTIAGLGMIAIAVFNKKFYWSKGRVSAGKPAPLWVGRLMFGAIGLLFLSAGAYNLFSR